MISEHVTRFYSLALGKYNNFNATTDGLISAGDTTPDVTLNSLLYANTAGTLAITDLDNGVEGQLVMITNRGTGLVTLAESCVTLNSASLGQYSNITLRKNLSKWYEVARGIYDGAATLRDSAILADSNATLTFGTGGSAANLYITNNTRVLVLHRTTRMVYKSFSGGYNGQEIKIIKVNSAHNELAIGTGNIVSTKTASNIVMTASSAIITALKFNDQWICSMEGVL